MELGSIFEDAMSIVGRRSNLVSTYVDPVRSINNVFITSAHLFGITRDEVLALCMLGIYNGIEFPKTPTVVSRGNKMFSGYNIPSRLQSRVFEMFSLSRNLHTLAIRGRHDVKYKSFRTGIMKLLFRWSVPDNYISFLHFGNGAMYDTLRIAPAVKQYNKIRGFPDISTMADKDRYKEYHRLQTTLGIDGYDMVFSQLYYHELPKADEIMKRRIWNDIMLMMETYDRPDLFGFPGFVFLPEDRLNRLLFMFAAASLRATESDDISIGMIRNNERLSSFIAPYAPVTDDVWKAGSDLWIRKHLLNNNTIHTGYIGAVARLGKLWQMDVMYLEELYRRICGYAGPPEFASVIDGKAITDNDIKSLQSGYDDNGNPVEMLNFKKALSLLSQFINDPSPLPFQTRPRYGILRCASCSEIGYASKFDFGRGCFDEVDPEFGMPVPVSSPSSLYNIALEYTCPGCKKVGCRELIVTLDNKCENCNTPGNVVSYRFEDLIPATADRYGNDIKQKDPGVAYDIYCELCKKTTEKRDIYDNEKVMFNDKEAVISDMKKKGEHGESLFLLTSPDNTTITRMIEIPYNIKEISPDKENDNIPCPYELIEEKKTESCCQDMPQAWERTKGPPKQVKIDRNNNGVHTTELVDTLRTETGFVVNRYICHNHRERIRKVIDNLGSDPALNPKEVLRGRLKWKKIFISDKPVKINSPKAKLLSDIIDMTRNMMDRTLHISDRIDIAQTETELENSMRSISEGMDVRHMFTFDRKDEPEPPVEVDCEELCSNWERLELVRATIPFERAQKKYKVGLQKTVVRQWTISHSPHKMVPTRSMPFIPTITPKERVKIKWGLTRTRRMASLVAVHIDVSISMNAWAFNIECPYILTENECEKCGSGYAWRDGKCKKGMDRIDASRRLLVGTIMSAQETNSSLMLYGFGTGHHLFNPSEYIVNKTNIPCKDYQLLIDYSMANPEIAPTDGGTRPDDSFVKMLNDLEEQDIDRVVTIMLTDGEFTTGGNFDRNTARILMEYGPIFIYQIGEMTRSKLRALVKEMENSARTYGWDPTLHAGIFADKVSVQDGAISLIRSSSKAVMDNLKQK